jgi:2-polyprenyl-6-hydroxyphenyl methylase/3-demethylubiquinone-9 3-methyltransferase
MVTCFEVVEHSLRPAETFAELESFMKQDGIVIFSTLLQRPAIEAEGVGWWYVAPRNGHVSLFTPKAILKLTRPYGLQLASFTENMHVMYRDPPPPFARHLFP